MSGLFPWGDPGDVARAQGETAEAGALLVRHGSLPLSGVEDPAAALAALADAGGLAGGPGLRLLINLLRANEAVRELSPPRGEAPRLSEIWDRIPDLSGPAGRAARLFEPDGSLSDNASPKLSQLRRSITRRRQRIFEDARGWLGRHAAAAAGDAAVVRDDRYCVPVHAGAMTNTGVLVRDRSGSGQTLFVEPPEFVEANNELALAITDERREEEAIRREFGRELFSRASDLARAAEALAELDAVAARARFGAELDAAAPEFSSDGTWEVSKGRHPLLDRRLASIRHGVLGESVRGGDAIPISISLAPDRRWLLLSGPNAGGKTVVLKTLGLFSMMAQCGFQIPCAAATLPLFSRFFALVGDDQSILSDLSSFSASLKGIAGVLRDADAGALILLDELGGGTDPEEGSALSAAVLEEILGRGARVVVTTHLSGLKNFASGRADAEVASMEFDEERGTPTFRVRQGVLGTSRALAAAAGQGLPEHVLSRARALLGAEWERREHLEEDLARAVAAAREAGRAAEAERFRLEELSASVESEREELARKRRDLLTAGRDALERARREFRSSAAEALRTIREERLSARKAQELLARVEDAAFASPEVREVEAGERAAAERLRAGDRVKLRGATAAADLVAIDGSRAWISSGGKRLEVPLAALEAAPRAARSSRVSTPPGGDGVPAEVIVIGQTVEDAVEVVDRAIDRSLLAGAGELRIVHGHGTGRLRDGLRAHVRQHPAVAAFRAGDAREGGNGATVVTFR